MVRLSWQRSSGRSRGSLTSCQVSESGHAHYRLSYMMLNRERNHLSPVLRRNELGKSATIRSSSNSCASVKQPFVMLQGALTGKHPRTVTASAITSLVCFLVVRTGGVQSFKPATLWWKIIMQQISIQNLTKIYLGTALSPSLWKRNRESCMSLPQLFQLFCSRYIKKKK